MHVLIFFIILLFIVCYLFYWHCFKEQYDNHDNLFQTYFEQILMKETDWKVVKTENYNDQMTFFEVTINEAQLFFTLEQYANREELRLVNIKNMTNHELKKKLEQNPILIHLKKNQ